MGAICFLYTFSLASGRWLVNRGKGRSLHGVNGPYAVVAATVCEADREQVQEEKAGVQGPEADGA